MKKNDLLLIIGTALFSFLFYRQGAGLNVFLFSLVMPVLMAVYKPDGLKNRLWLFGAFLTILTGFSVFANSTFLALFAFYTAISYLAGVTVSRNASPFPAISYASFSYSTSVGYMISDTIERRKAGGEREKKKIRWNSVILLSFFIFIVVAMFFFLYQSANPLFKEITKFINLDFISFQWIMFTFLGFLLMYGFFYTRFIKLWDNSETINNSLINKEQSLTQPNKFLWFSMDEQMERKAGIILFALLNIMILTINLLDISFLWSGIHLPDGFTFAEYLHQGIYTLIFSCVIAILLILLIFRGKLNFLDNNRSLKLLAYIWIFQNIFIAISSALRNYIYISSYALTYKRIIIFFLLILLITGLITTLIKIIKVKNIYYLFRFNSFAFLILFSGISLLNWDGIITNFNIRNSKHPDISYLVDLNESGLPSLLKYAESEIDGEKVSIDKIRRSSFFTPESYYWQRPSLTDIIYDKTYNLLKKNSHSSWKSYNLSESITIKNIRKLYAEGIISQFIVNNKENFELHLLTDFKGLRKLSINNSTISDSAWLSQLETFSNLKDIQLREMRLSAIDDLPLFKELNSINLSNNDIKNFNHLKNYKTITHLDISENPVENITFIAELPGIELLNLSNTNVKDFSVIAKTSGIKTLLLKNMINADFSTLPTCPELKEIDLSYNSGLSSFKNLPQFISEAKNLQTVRLLNTGIGSLVFFSDTVLVLNKVTVGGQHAIDQNILEHIRYLDVSSNSLQNLKGLQNFKGLHVLIAENNYIEDIRQIRYCPNLRELDLTGNPVQSLKNVDYLKNLQYLHLSSFIFSDISSLGNLTQLEALTLSSGNLQNIEHLRKIKNLKYLDLSNSVIPSLSFLADLTQLEFINLTGYAGNDIEQLLQCSSLKVVVIHRIPMKLKHKLEQEIPQIRIIRDWEFENQEFYKTKYGTLGE